MKTATAPEQEWYENISRSARRATLLGIGLLGTFVLGFGAWAGTALIAGAIVTSGAFVATGDNKIVQHPDGGVIKDILVHEGDRVQEGQTLVLLDDTAPRAELRRLVLREAHLESMRLRLQAEAERRATLQWPAEFDKYRGDHEIQSILEAQMSTFVARRRNIDSDVASLRESIKALEERIQAGKIQVASVERQVSLYSEEAETKSKLVSKGLGRKSEVLALERGIAASRGEVARLIGDLGDARDRIARTNEQINGVYTTATKASMEQLHEALAELQDVRERILSSQAVLKRVKITAPVRGVVVKMRYHTAGGVVEPGRSIMEILPVDDNLLIEARIRPQDIEHVSVGQQATIRLSTMSSRSTPMIEGSVVYVSADAVSAADRGGINANMDGNARDVYMVRVKVGSGELDRVPGFRPVAGMPVEIFIRTGERTFFSYITKPITDSFSRAFREI